MLGKCHVILGRELGGSYRAITGVDEHFQSSSMLLIYASINARTMTLDPSPAKASRCSP